MTRYRKPELDPADVHRAVEAFAPAPNLDAAIAAAAQRRRDMKAENVRDGPGGRLLVAIYNSGATVNEWAAQQGINPRTVRGWLEERAPVPGWVWERLR